ncbi:MAG: hypothetical protein ACOY94_20345 [Bacillota bacterium]
MVWLLIGILIIAAIVGVGMMRAPGGRARNRLNNEGWPRPFTRERHEQNDEE